MLDGRRRNPPGGAPMPRWTEPEMENEDRGKRRRALLFLRRGGCYFVFERILLIFELITLKIVWRIRRRNRKAALRTTG